MADVGETIIEPEVVAEDTEVNGEAISSHDDDDNWTLNSQSQFTAYLVQQIPVTVFVCANDVSYYARTYSWLGIR